MDRTDLEQFLARHPPFAELDPGTLAEMAGAARVVPHGAGDLILDAFLDPSVETFVVVEGEVDVWDDRDRILEAADERLGPGAVFGFSAMLTERSVGPRVVAVGDVVVAAIPAAVVEPALTSAEGARFLAEHLSAALRRATGNQAYSLVEELIAGKPLLVEPSAEVAEVAVRMTEHGVGCAVVELADGPSRYGLVTDALLRSQVLAGGRAPTTPVGTIVDVEVPAVDLGDTAAEALMLMLERDAGYLLVLDDAGLLRGVVEPRDFAVSPSTAGVSLHEQLRRASSVAELGRRGRQVTAMMIDLLARGLTSGRVIAIYSAMIDTLVRRAIELVFDQHPELPIDAFTWLSLGSNGRREAVPSSDVDSAVAFIDTVDHTLIGGYRVAFDEVHAVLASAGLSRDDHGAIASRAAFSRTNAEWRSAGLRWMSAPHKNQGAVMASLLVDGRPIYGDPGLPAVSHVFSDLRQHKGTMRLLLQESLAHRAKLHSMLDVLTRRSDTFDIKTYAILPIVNLARWAALSVGSAVLPTTDRLRAAAGSAMLPEERVQIIVEAFEVLQRLRLRYQLLQVQRGEQPSDLLTMDRLSPIDRSIVTQAVREIAAIQRRMDNVSQRIPIGDWTAPET
ncbi:putative nucleotidyltransferase substrate binding domain-containing protein [Microlunatus ginsengisoli]|uniref:DUF294 nucleotidyltransferase-like domain-containing protein n=1 Tax=Microlunatus ginsengisoli TaxID=363863 RepID=A0ABP7A4R8_9ACTN